MLPDCSLRRALRAESRRPLRFTGATQGLGLMIAACALMADNTAAFAAQAARPNVVIILADDKEYPFSELKELAAEMATFSLESAGTSPPLPHREMWANQAN